MSSDGGIITKLLGLSGSIRRESFNTAILPSLAERLRGDVSLILHPLNEVSDCDDSSTLVPRSEQSSTRHRRGGGRNASSVTGASSCWLRPWLVRLVADENCD